MVQDDINNDQQSDEEEIGAEGQESSSFVQDKDCYDDFDENDCFDYLNLCAD